MSRPSHREAQARNLSVASTYPNLTEHAQRGWFYEAIEQAHAEFATVLSVT